jgi:hypothetical protein
LAIFKKKFFVDKVGNGTKLIEIRIQNRAKIATLTKFFPICSVINIAVPINFCVEFGFGKDVGFRSATLS